MEKTNGAYDKDKEVPYQTYAGNDVHYHYYAMTLERLVSLERLSNDMIEEDMSVRPKLRSASGRNCPAPRSHPCPGAPLSSALSYFQFPPPPPKQRLRIIFKN